MDPRIIKTNYCRGQDDYESMIASMQPWEIVSYILENAEFNLEKDFFFIIDNNSDLFFENYKEKNIEKFIDDIWKTGDIFIIIKKGTIEIGSMLINIGYNLSLSNSEIGHWLSDDRKFDAGIIKILSNHPGMVINVSHDADAISIFHTELAL